MGRAIVSHIAKFLLAFLTVAGGSAQALTLDANLFYLSDALTTTGDRTATSLFWDLAVTINMDKKGYWVIGWAYNSMTITETGSTSADFTLTEMGPKVGYYIDKAKVWSIFLVYSFQSQADFSDATSTAEWRGTSYKAEFGFTPAFTESFHAGVKLNYYQANFSEQFVSGTTFSTISNARSIIYPTVAFVYRFGN